MAVDWTPHRFSGGVLALDVANTVVHRGVPEKRFDRFAEADEIARFAEAACRVRPTETGTLRVADPAGIKPRVVALREAIDALFRDASHSQSLDAPKLEAFLRGAADCIAGHPGRFGRPSADAGEPVPFEAALGFSALSLLAEERWRRVRTCSACAWLFLDASRNGSRRWCDMAVCGNRQKARRSYRRRQAGGETGHA